MAVITITRDARCTDCKYFKQRYPINKDGSKSKRTVNYCEIPLVSKRTWTLTRKDKACDKWEL